MKSIYYFRNDLRLDDNIGFINCYEKSKEIIPIYIFEDNIHQEFKLNILQHLSKQININIYFGNPIHIINDIIKKEKIKHIFFNCEYDIYSKIKDNSLIENIKKNHDVSFNIYEDKLLTNITKLLNNNKNLYTKYDKFLKKIKKVNINNPKQININKEKTKKINDYIINISKQNYLADRNKIINIFNKLNKNIICLSESKISIYLKYGIISIRELYYTLLSLYKKINYKLINELYRREFYYYIAFYDNNFINYDNIHNNKDFKNVMLAKTDNSKLNEYILELNSKNILNNRKKIYIFNYLKNNNIDYRIGDIYLSKKLIDYDIILNNGLCKYVNNFYINPTFKN